jgi:drug/metabolite transporter (DMT)-like permease
VKFGLLAALAWGIADLTAAIVARRIGSRRTVIVSQVSGFLGFLAMFVLLGQPWRIPAGQVALLVVSGTLGGVAYFALYRGLELGPIHLVSPIASAFGAVAVLLAVVLLGEHLAPMVTAGIVVTLVGLLLATSDLTRIRVEARKARRGIPFALVAMAGFGVVAFISGSRAQEYGWLQPVLLSRTGAMLMILCAAPFRRRDEQPQPRWTGYLVAALVGLADVAGIGAFARSSELGLVAIAAASSATFTLIPVLGGILLFGERPVPNQAIGVVLVMAGLFLLGLG